MKCYVELVTVGKGELVLTVLDNVPDHDTECLMYLKPLEREGWLRNHHRLVLSESIQSLIEDEAEELKVKREGIYIRVIDTHG